MTQATFHEIGSNFGVYFDLIALKSLVSAKGCIQTYFTWIISLKSEFNQTICRYHLESHIMYWALDNSYYITIE